MSFIAWLRKSFEDNDGNASYRRLTAFFASLIDGFIVIAQRVNSEIMLNVHYSLLVFILLLTGIITTQNIIQFIKSKQP